MPRRGGDGGGAFPADDLVTGYTYNVFGDLFCTKLPRGNGIESICDTAGRLKEVIRGTAVAVPTSTSCLDAALPRERTAYQLDVAGNRIEESLERWSGGAWVSDSKTAYVHTCHLDKVTQGAGSSTPSVTEYCYDLNDNLELHHGDHFLVGQVPELEGDWASGLEAGVRWSEVVHYVTFSSLKDYRDRITEAPAAWEVGRGERPVS